MKKLLFLILVVFSSQICNAVAQDPPEMDFSEFEQLDFQESERPPARRDSNGDILPPMDEDDTQWDHGVSEADMFEMLDEPTDDVAASEFEAERETPNEGQVLETAPHSLEPPSRSRSNPFRHLSEMPGQYRGDWMHLVKMKFVRKEIELIKEQEMAIYRVSRKFKKLSRKYLREEGDVGLPNEDNDKHDQLQHALSKFREDAVEEVRDDILLPQQVQRLKEIDFQLKVKSQGIIATLKDEELGMNVSEDQLGEIEERAKELVEEYDLLMRSFKIDFRNKILDQLNSGQRSKIESLMGEDFQVMGDEGDEGTAVSEELKEAALRKLEEYRAKQ